MSPRTFQELSCLFSWIMLHVWLQKLFNFIESLVAIFLLILELNIKGTRVNTLSTFNLYAFVNWGNSYFVYIQQVAQWPFFLIFLLF